MTQLEQDYCNLAVETLLDGSCTINVDKRLLACVAACSTCTAYSEECGRCKFNTLLSNDEADAMSKFESQILLPFLEANHPELLL